jgi:hypothetical protein
MSSHIKSTGFIQHRQEDADTDDALPAPGARRPLGHCEEEDDQEARKGGAHEPQA